MAMDQLGQKPPIKFEAGKNYLVMHERKLTEISVLQLAGTYMLGKIVDYDDTISKPQWGEANKYEALAVVSQENDLAEEIAQRSDCEAIELLRQDRFEPDAYYLHTKDLTLRAQHDQRTDFKRVVEHAENYTEAAKDAIGDHKKVYFVHPNGGIQLIKLQS